MVLTESLFKKILSVNTTPKMRAVIGYVFDIILTDPIITEMYITKGEDLVICSTSVNPLNHILSNYDSFKENWIGFFNILNDVLTEEEKQFINTQYKKKLKKVIILNN